MTGDTPDIREFCFSANAPMRPEMMLAVWAKTYLDTTQFAEFKRLIHEVVADNGPGGQASVEQMIGIIEMAQFLAN